MGLVLVAVAAAPAASQSTPRLEGEWLVLTREVFEAGTSEIYRVRPDGSELTNLTNGIAADYSPALSPDGTKIAFASALPEGGSALFLMDVDGGNRRPITAEYADQPDWSPDGRSIVFVDRSLDLALMESDGSNQRKLLETPDSERSPNWSPDGTRIVYNVFSVVDGVGLEALFVLTVADLAVARLSEDADLDSEPDWSPDGTAIAFVSLGGSGGNIHAINPDGTDRRVLVPSASNDFSPGWSPDGTRVVFKAVRNEGFAIVVFDLATGTGADILTSVVGEPTWQGPSWTGVVIDPTLPVTTTVPGATTTVLGATTTVAGATTTLVAGAEGEATESSDGLLIGVLIAALVVSAFLGGILFTKRSGALGQPPPPPPPPPPAARPAWFPLAVGGGVAAVVLIGLLASGVFDDDAPVAGATTTTTAPASTSSNAGDTTTTPVTTTTVAATSTTVADTTTTIAAPVPVVADSFEGSSPAAPLFDNTFMTFTITDQGRGRVRALQGSFILPVLYPDPVGDALITLRIRPELRDPASGAGVIVYADDPSDGALDRFVLIEIREGTAEVDVRPFADATYGPNTVTAIPDGAAFDPTGLNDVMVVLDGGTITVSINGTLVVEWAGPAPAADGYYGFYVAARVPDDAMVVDDFVVLAP